MSPSSATVIPAHSLVKAPRLIVDWSNVSVHHSPHLVSQELFFNCCFALMLGMLRMRLVADKDLWHFTHRFGLLWSFVSNAADYATRFNDDDLWHTVLWGGYGLGLISIAMHMNSSGAFHFSVAYTKLWVAMAWFRVALALPRCRAFALIFGGALVCGAVIVIALGLLHLHGTSLELFPFLIQPATSIFVAYAAPRGVDIPMNIYYHIPKFDGFLMLVFGQFVSAVATPPCADGPVDFAAFYSTAICSALALISFKLIFSDCEASTILVEHHAIRRSKRTALTWLLICQPGKSFAVVVGAAGISLLLGAKNSGSDGSHLFGTSLTCYASSALFALAFIEGRQHAPDPTAECKPELQRCQDTFTAMLLGCAAICLFLPSAQLLSVVALPLIALMACGTAGLGLVYKSKLSHARCSHLEQRAEAKQRQEFGKSESERRKAE